MYFSKTQGCQSGAMALKLVPEKIYERQVGNHRHQGTEEDVQKIVVCDMLSLFTLIRSLIFVRS